METKVETLLKAYSAALLADYQGYLARCRVQGDCDICNAARLRLLEAFRDFRHSLAEVVLGFNPENDEYRVERDRLHSYVMNYRFKLPAR